MIDRSTKIILVAIAAGLWANVLVNASRPANADSFIWRQMNIHLDGINTYTHAMEANIHRIAKGECVNKKLC
jgi:hypothetical protein